MKRRPETKDDVGGIKGGEGGMWCASLSKHVIEGKKREREEYSI